MKIEFLRANSLRAHLSRTVNLAHVEKIGELYLHIAMRRIPFSKTKRKN